jgi:hypothetical protein
METGGFCRLKSMVIMKAIYFQWCTRFSGSAITSVSEKFYWAIYIHQKGVYRHLWFFLPLNVWWCCWPCWNSFVVFGSVKLQSHICFAIVFCQGWVFSLHVWSDWLLILCEVQSIIYNIVLTCFSILFRLDFNCRYKFLVLWKSYSMSSFISWPPYAQCSVIIVK